MPEDLNCLSYEALVLSNIIIGLSNTVLLYTIGLAYRCGLNTKKNNIIL